MKISTFFDIYTPVHETKDPGQISLGLIDNGVDAEVITVSKKELVNYHPKFGVVEKSLSELYDDAFWLENGSEAIIGYPLQGGFYSQLIEKMKAGGKKVLLKLDDDGRIAYPLQRRSHRVPLRERLTAKDIVSDLYWRLPFKSFKRRKHANFTAEAIRQMEFSDAVIIESPDALANLDYFLAAWGRVDLISKTHFIPNPVTPEFVEGEIGKKGNIAVAHGRWEDYRVKNTGLMVETVIAFLKQRQDFKFIIFGSGTDQVKNLLNSAPQHVRDRIDVRGYIEHRNVKDIVSNAKLLFVPSRWESFSIASAEALCSGCSIVGTPAEALRYLSMQGFSGTIAATFDKEAILAALVQDATKWDNGYYDPQKIAAFWRPKLDRKTIAKSIENLVKTT